MASPAPTTRALAALIAVVATMAIVTACAKQPTPDMAAAVDKLSWPRAERGARLFVAGKDGLEAFKPDAKPAVASAEPGGLPRVVAIAARGIGESGDAPSGALRPGEALCAIALEGWGAAFVETGKDGRSLHIGQRRIDALAGLEIGGLWATTSGWILPTFRNPFADPKDFVAANPGGVHLISNETAKTIALPPLAGLAPGYELFAFLPDPRKPGSWLAQFRNSSGSKVTSLWAAYPKLDLGAEASAAKASDAGKQLSREVFEAALSPRPLSSAPESLLHAVAALGEAKDGSALLRVDGASGESLWYRWGSDPGSSREIHGWIDATGDILLLTPEGRAALASAAPDSGNGSPARSRSLSQLPQGASFSGCALFENGDGERRDDGAGNLRDLWIVASWEGVDAFGNEATGILVCPALQ